MYVWEWRLQGGKILICSFLLSFMRLVLPKTRKYTSIEILYFFVLFSGLLKYEGVFGMVAHKRNAKFRRR